MTVVWALARAAPSASRPGPALFFEIAFASRMGRTAVYAKFYGLAESPFRITPDPRFLYLGPAHREALATLIYGIRESKGIVALTGGVGTGKTTLLEGLFERLGGECVFVRIRDPRADFSSMLRELLAALGFPSTGVERSEAMRLLWERLSSPESAGIRPVLVIDEAQDVRDEVLEDFRLLSNLETHEQKLVQMLLVGQPEFRRRIEAPALEALRQRIALSTTIHPLTVSECSAYVRHRLMVAGGEADGIFALGAFEAIHEYARGIPRLVNVVCDGALSMGYATGTRPIHAGLVREVVKDLKGEERSGVPADPPSVTLASPVASRSTHRPSPRLWGALAATAGALILGVAIGPASRGRSRETTPIQPPSLAATRVLSTPEPARAASAHPSAEGPRPSGAGEPGARQAVPAPEPQAVTALAPSALQEASAAKDTQKSGLEPEGLGQGERTTSAPMTESEPVAGPSLEPPAAPEPTFEGEPRLEDSASPESEIVAPIEPSRAELAREREQAAKARARKEKQDARELKAKEARDKKNAKSVSVARSSDTSPVTARPLPSVDQSSGGDESGLRASSGASSAGSTWTAEPIKTAALTPPSTSSPSARAIEPKVVIVPDSGDGAAESTQPVLKVRELYATHRSGGPEISPRFVPGDSLELVAIYELAHAPTGGGDVAIDLWIRGPNQEDLPSLGARRMLPGRSGTFQAKASRTLPSNAPAGVYGLVARVTYGGIESRRVFLFRVE